MTRPRSCGLLVALTLFAGPAGATEIMRSRDVKPGMTGYGLSVFRGTKIERFRVKVLGVLRNTFPKMDMILIRCAGANLEHSGIVAGMSGSPIYLVVDGRPRLIGALAYGWMFSKDPVAGVTPIANMLAEARRPLRHPLGPAKRLLSHPQLKPAATPLFVSGALGSVIRLATPLLEKWGFMPLQGSGGVDASQLKEKVELEPGAAIGVQLMSGDLDMTAVGTVTYRDKETILAFGHPMLGIGELRFPISTAYVHHTFAGLARSFKMAGPIAQVGTLVQDRVPAVVGKIGPRTPMIPLRIVVTNPDSKRRDVYQMRVVHHEQFTPTLAFIALLNSLQSSASDRDDVSFSASLRLELEGYPPIQLSDHLFSPDGILGMGLFSSPVLQALQRLYTNRFTKVRAKRLDYEVKMVFKRDLDRLEAVRFENDALTPGKTARAVVRFRPYLGKPYHKVLEFPIPESVDGQTIQIQFAGGARAPLDLAPPDSFPDLIRNVVARHPSKSVVVSMQVPSRTLKVRGQNLTDLPRTVVDVLNPAGAAGLGIVTGGMKQTVIPTERVVAGARVVRIRVKALDE